MGLLDWSIPVHGNYVGPGYTGGQRHPRVGNYKIKPVSKLDALARKHDYRYEKGQSVAKADADMAKEALKLFTEELNPLDLATAAVLGAKSLIAEDNGVPLTEVPAELDPDSALSVKTVTNKYPNKNSARTMVQTVKVKMAQPKKAKKHAATSHQKKDHATHSATKSTLVVSTSGKTETRFTRQGKFLHGTKPGDIRIQRLEYLGVLNGYQGNFIVNQYNINPGISLTFPWLATLAGRFEKYFIHSCRIVCSPRVASTTPGGTYIACDYDSADASPTAKNTLFELGTYADAQCWQKMDVVLNRSRLNNSIPHHFIRTGPLASNLDIKTYDCGQFFVCTDATPASVNQATSGGTASYSLPSMISDMYIEYDIELIEPSDAVAPLLNYWQNSAVTINGGSFQPTGTMTTIFNNDPSVIIPTSAQYAVYGGFLYFTCPGTWLVAVTFKVNTSSGTTGVNNITITAAPPNGQTAIGTITNSNTEVCSNSSSGGTSAYFTINFTNASQNLLGTVEITSQGSASSYGPCSIVTTRLN
jgi:hypothetical protein